MKSLFKIAVASLGLAVIAAVSSPAMATDARVDIRLGNGYHAQPAYVEHRVIHAPAPGYHYRDGDRWRHHQWREQEWRRQQWREHQWRERERREHYWRQRQEWRGHEWRDQRERDYGRGDGYYGGHRHGEGRRG